MKRTVILILGAALALSLSLVLCVRAAQQSSGTAENGLFDANVDALAETTHWGTCEGNPKVIYCDAQCENCKQWFTAHGYNGPGKITTHVCEKAPGGEIKPIEDGVSPVGPAF